MEDAKIQDAPQAPADSVIDPTPEASADNTTSTATGSAARGWYATRCTNNTGENILVYNNGALYLLRPGQSTAGFDCDGFFVPTDRKFNGEWGAKAAKYRDYIEFTVNRSGSTYTVSGGLFAGLFWNPNNNPANWDIPNWSTEQFRNL